MKRLTKILFVAGGSLLLTGGAVANYLAAQPQTLQEELTLANLEAMASPLDGPDSGSWANGPSHDVDCARCGSTHVHCEGRKKGTRCQQTSCLN